MAAILKTAPVSTTTGLLKLQVFGSSLQLYWEGNLVASVIDTRLTTGGVGIRSQGPATLDNFSVQELITGTPFTDDFNSTTNTLATPWFHRLGKFVGSNGAIRGTAATNLALLAGITRNDVEVSADFVLANTINSSASLVARSTGPGDANQYLATVRRTSTGWVASLERKLGTVTTVLASTAITSGIGQLKLQVIGSTLTLSINGTSLLSVTDMHLSSVGVGIRTSANVTLDNLSVM